MSQPIVKPQLFGVVGWKNSGKTTLIVKLVVELTRRGYLVSSIKHAHHSALIDRPGSDSDKHRLAGTVETAIITDKMAAILHDVRNSGDGCQDDGLELEKMLARLLPVDIVLVEGFKNFHHPKILVRRQQARDIEMLIKPNIVAIASDLCAGERHGDESDGLPIFALDDIQAIADFIIEYS